MVTKYKFKTLFKFGGPKTFFDIKFDISKINNFFRQFVMQMQYKFKGILCLAQYVIYNLVPVFVMYHHDV